MLIEDQQKEQIKKDIDQAWLTTEDNLYMQLGLSLLGNKDMSEAFGSMKMLMSVAENTNGAAAKSYLSDWLKKQGKISFKELWEGIRGIACKIHSEKMQVGGKDLAVYIVDALVVAGHIANPLLVLVVTIAVKEGLDSLCAVHPNK